MEKHDFEELIDQKILQAKLSIAEKRIQFLLWLGGAILALFGVIIPIWQTNTSIEKVDKAISEMQTNFEKLAGAQSRKPVLICLFNDKNISNQEIVIEPNSNISMLIKNIGNGAAQHISIRFYYSSFDTTVLPNSAIKSIINPTYFDYLEKSDDPTFPYAYGLWELPTFLNPQESLPIFFYFNNIDADVEYLIRIKAKLVIYHNEPEPTTINFVLVRQPNTK
ncbi:MAG: hypothetical protein JXA54_10765 [Candidatus Heimdallarchaeota archaeon]|nr:hypothetical protein [Candidatus Heimdallarchaeota archaeon]